MLVTQQSKFVFPLGHRWIATEYAGKDDSLLRRGFQLEEMPPALPAAVL